MLNKSFLAHVTESLVVLLTTLLAFGTILLIANNMFEWDLFPPQIELGLYFLGASSLVLIFAATLINIMLSISKIATHLGSIVEEKQK